MSEFRSSNERRPERGASRDAAVSRAAKRSTYDRALDMLEARSRGVAELRRLLIRKGEPEAEVDAAIERLTSSGVLDDANFARQLTRSKATGAGLSRRRIGQELAKRGVSREISDEAIENVFDEEGIDEEASIDRVARKKLRMLAKVDDATRRRRLYAFLARRGYDNEAISRVLQTLLATDPGNEHDP
jgi:regulatory protein